MVVIKINRDLRWQKWYRHHGTTWTWITATAVKNSAESNRKFTLTRITEICSEQKKCMFSWQWCIPCLMPLRYHTFVISFFTNRCNSRNETDPNSKLHQALEQFTKGLEFSLSIRSISSQFFCEFQIHSN